jgi:hypothetical protein
MFKDFCQQIGMKVAFASVYHPQTNGVVERANSLMYEVEAVVLEEVKHRSLRTAIGTPACPSEAKEKDLLESDRLKVVANLQKYQEETRP